ncbi:MAG: hypothetical protein AB7V43_22725 [Acidimicrobiia bacterium]
MTPRVPIPRSALDAGAATLNDVFLKWYVPSIRPARRQMRVAMDEMTSVDPVTKELVRLRNAKLQGCGL